jgi:integrase
MKRRSVYGRTRKKVAERLRKKQEEREAGSPIYDERLTVGGYLDHWVTTVLPHRVANETLSNSTYHSYADTVRIDLKPAVGHLRLTELKAAHIDRLIASKRCDYSASSLRIMRTTLRKALRDGYKADRVPLSALNAIEHSEPIEVNRRARAYLSQRDARSLLEQTKGDRLEALYVLLLSLGLRRGEALGLYWSDINFEKKTVTIQ